MTKPTEKHMESIEIRVTFTIEASTLDDDLFDMAADHLESELSDLEAKWRLRGTRLQFLEMDF